MCCEWGRSRGRELSCAHCSSAVRLIKKLVLFWSKCVFCLNKYLVSESNIACVEDTDQHLATQDSNGAGRGAHWWRIQLHWVIETKKTSEQLFPLSAFIGYFAKWREPKNKEHSEDTQSPGRSGVRISSIPRLKHRKVVRCFLFFFMFFGRIQVPSRTSGPKREVSFLFLSGMFSQRIADACYALLRFQMLTHIKMSIKSWGSNSKLGINHSHWSGLFPFWIPFELLSLKRSEIMNKWASQERS